jgi:hypothetical protein
MTAQVTAEEGQALAESLMVDSCTITRRGGDPVFDDTTGTYTPATPTTVYTGVCKVRPSNLSGNTTAQAGEREVSLWPFSVSIPVAEDADLDDVVTVTASLDPSLVGRTLRVRSVARGTYLTARRLDCEEVST